MEIKNQNNGLQESDIIIAGEKAETASVKSMSKKFEGALPQDGNIYYHEISPNCLALISSAEVFVGNRVLGIGSDEKAGESLIKEIKNFYKKNKKEKFFIQLAPAENNRDTSELLKNNGAEIRNSWVKLYKIPEAKINIQSDILIEELKEKDHGEVASLLLRSFSFPEELRTFCLYAFGKPGWKNYTALLNDIIAGTGSLYIKDGIAEIGIAATSEEARGKGIQTALILYRENKAFEEGCRYLFVETAEPTASYTAPSYRNMIRLGFKELYRRPNYLLMV